MTALLKYLEAARLNAEAVHWHGKGCRNPIYAGALDDPRKLRVLAKDTLENHRMIMRFLWDTFAEVFDIFRPLIVTYHSAGPDTTFLQPLEIAKIENVLREMALEKEFDLEDWL